MKLSQALLSSLVVALSGCSEKVNPKPENNTNGNSVSTRPDNSGKNPLKKEEDSIAVPDSVQAAVPENPDDDYYYCPPCGRG